MQHYSVQLQHRHGAFVCRLGRKRKRPDKLPDCLSFHGPRSSSCCGRFCLLRQANTMGSISSSGDGVSVWSVAGGALISRSPEVPEVNPQAQPQWLPGPGARLLCSAFQSAEQTGQLRVLAVTCTGVRIAAASPVLQRVKGQAMSVSPSGSTAALTSATGIFFCLFFFSIVATADGSTFHLAFSAAWGAMGYPPPLLHFSPDSTQLLVKVSRALGPGYTSALATTALPCA